MPQAIIQLFREKNGTVPTEIWLADLENKVPKVFAKCVHAILELERLGYEARRPLVAPLRDGIYELRLKQGHVNYRLLYFFNGPNVVVVSHGLTKEREVPDVDINRAIKHRSLVEANPQQHLAVWGNQT